MTTNDEVRTLLLSQSARNLALTSCLIPGGTVPKQALTGVALPSKQLSATGFMHKSEPLTVEFGVEFGVERGL